MPNGLAGIVDEVTRKFHGQEQTMSMEGHRLLRLPEVLRATGLSRSNLYRKIKVGEFPSPVQLGERAVGWRESEVIGWIDGRPPTSE